MKISELIKLHGVPVKVRLPHWKSNEWFEVIADKRHIAGAYPGFTSNGCAMVRDDDFEDYELYVEPKPKLTLIHPRTSLTKNLYAYLTQEIGPSSTSIYSGSYVIVLLTEEVDSKHSNLIRAPQFDCEI